MKEETFLAQEIIRSHFLYALGTTQLVSWKIFSALVKILATSDFLEKGFYREREREKREREKERERERDGHSRRLSRLDFHGGVRASSPDGVSTLFDRDN